MKQPLVSIVTPVYNAAKFLEDTIASVQNQTYENWELIFVDDQSTDSGLEIISEAIKHDPRIKLIKNRQNSGAGRSRNRGVEAAAGRYICFFDADDLWHPSKLAKQLDFMEQTGAAFSCTSYEFADESGKPNGKKVIVPKKASYRELLTNVTVWTSTTMFDMSQLSKSDIEMPDIRRGQDAATWWKVLKRVGSVYGLQDVLAYYRRTSSSLSANKLKALKRTWYLYRNIEKINPITSAIYLVQHSYNATRRRI